MDTIKPPVVLASGKSSLLTRFIYDANTSLLTKSNRIGDLTDAKAKDKMGSKQILEEWQYYKQVLDDVEISKRTLWLDVRGNHGSSSD